MFEKIALVVEYIFIAVAALSFIIGVVTPILILIFAFLINLGYKLITGCKDAIMSNYEAPFVLMIGLMLISGSLSIVLFIDVLVTRYYYPELFNILFNG